MPEMFRKDESHQRDRESGRHQKRSSSTWDYGRSSLGPRPKRQGQQRSPNTASTIILPLNSPPLMSGFTLTPSLPIHRWQVNIQRLTRLRGGLPGVPPHLIFQMGRRVQPLVHRPSGPEGERYNLFSGNCHPFHKDMAPDLPSPPLNVLPSSIRFSGKSKDYHVIRPLYP